MYIGVYIGVPLFWETTIFPEKPHAPDGVCFPCLRGHRGESLSLEIVEVPSWLPGLLCFASR